MLATEIIFSAVSNILSIYLAFRMINIVLTRRREPVIPPVIVYFLVWLLNWVIFYFLNIVIVTISSTLLSMFVASLFLYEGNLSKRIFGVVSSLALGMVSESAIWILFGGLDELQINMALGSLFSSFLEMLFIILLEKVVRVKKNEQIAPKGYFNIVIMILGSIFLGEILVKLGGENQNLAMVGLGIIGVIDVCTYHIYDKINEAYMQKLEQEVLKQQVEMYEHQFEVIEQSNRNIRAIRHDLKNHLYLIKSYLDENDTEKASQYIEDINQHMTISNQYVDTGNQEVDTIINFFYGKAIQLNCEVEAKLEIPEESFMNKVDLNILLGNLLDNAIEALAKEEERKLSIYMKYKKGVLVVKIENSFHGALVKKGKKLVTSKLNSENHGIGLQNVDQIVSKYKGERRINEEMNMFSISVFLFVEAINQ